MSLEGSSLSTLTVRARRSRAILLGVSALVLALVVPAQASAAQIASTTVSADEAVYRSCTETRLGSGPGVDHESVTAPVSGWVSARLAGGSGDWDLAIFAGDTLIAGSAYRGSEELAEGLVTAGADVTVQACRLSGAGDSASLTVESIAVDTTSVQKASLVKVSTPTRERKNELNSLGLDVTEHGGENFVDVVLHGAADATKLTAHNFMFVTETPDLAAQSKQDRQADLAFAAANASSDFPSGRTTYRRLFDYGEDMKRLAREHPDLVRPITLAEETYEGRPVEGIEVASNVNARDGRPVFVQMGVHHAREWPSSEHAIEWAYEVIIAARGGDARALRLLDTTRLIVVPVVNPDGFNTSREAGQMYMHGEGHHTDLNNNRDISDEEFVAAAVANHHEYKRKNCRHIDGVSEGGSCLEPDTGVLGAGVDPNRNYGAFWGGPGSGSDPLGQTYRGPSAFSEPETRNVQKLVSSRHVTALITNHTFSNLVLRPPGLQEQGLAPDEPAMKTVGDAMAAENGYSSQYGWQLYDTSGTTEDWSYSSTGGYGYTFEIGLEGFHPPFEKTVAEWNGTSPEADSGGRDGGGNRGAYYIAQEAAADPAHHSVLAGRAPDGAVLRLHKQFQTPTYSGETFTDTLDSTMQVANGTFEWHVNPSTRPLVQNGTSGREATGEPSAPIGFSSRIGSTVPCADFDNPPATCYEDHLIKVQSGPGIDNGKMKIRIEWPTPASDWDFKIYRADANGQATGDPVGQSAQGTTNFEETTLLEPQGDYVIRVINWAAAEPWTGTVTFLPPDPPQASVETYTLFCEQPEGTIRSARQVQADRGQRVSLDLRKDCKRTK